MTRATLDFSVRADEAILTFHPDGSITVGAKWRDCPDKAAQAIIASLEREGWTRHDQQWLHDAPTGKDYEIYRLRAALTEIKAHTKYGSAVYDIASHALGEE